MDHLSIGVTNEEKEILLSAEFRTVLDDDALAGQMAVQISTNGGIDPTASGASAIVTALEKVGSADALPLAQKITKRRLI